MSVIRFFFEDRGRLGQKGYVIGVIAIVLANLTWVVFVKSLNPSEPNIVLILALLIPSLFSNLAITARRCHDFNQSLFATFWRDQIPVVGPIMGAIDVFGTPSDSGSNRYGPPSKL